MENKIGSFAETYRKSKSSYNFLDSNCWLTFWEQRETFYQTIGIEALWDELKKHDIREAVVSCTECLEYDPFTGNDRLIESIVPYKNLYGGIVLTPEITFGRNNIGSYLDKAINKKIVAVRMFPKRLRHSMKKWQVGDILSYMEQRRLPLMLWHMETSWDMIQSICEDYKELPVIIEGNDQKLLYHNRYYIPLLKTYKNLYIETHNLINYLGIEALVNEQQIEQLIFGTYLPYNDPNSSMMMITHADIEERAKLKIAGGNMRMLIDNIKR